MVWLLIIGLLVCYARSQQHYHQYVKISFKQEYDERRNLRYSVRTYKCSVCNKIKEVDTRYGDPYDR